jgi:hypothetical protein
MNKNKKLPRMIAANGGRCMRSFLDVRLPTTTGPKHVLRIHVKGRDKSARLFFLHCTRGYTM